MIIAALKEMADPRVALTPEATKKLIDLGNEVLIEKGAGKKAWYDDQLYVEAGAKVVDRPEALAQGQVLLGINSPDLADLKSLKEGQVVVAMFNPLTNTDLAAEIIKLPSTAFSLDRVPRITIAQSMDVLSSMASLAGYKAVILAADLLPEYFPMLMTAAGTIPPAKVLILGAGVAGLQAIATARRLGATVEAFDVRSAVKEEVESLGAKFVEVEGAREDEAAGGYAVEQSEEYQQKQKELIHERASRSNVIITTANIPGKPAPKLIEERTVKAMKAGSVIIDLAAATGGNCEVTKNGETIVYEGVTVVGNSNLPGEMPLDASRLFANNLVNFIKYVFPENQPAFDPENEVAKGAIIS